MYNILVNIPRSACNQWNINYSELTNPQSAEVKRFISGDYDVVLGMLERRKDRQTSSNSQVRQKIVDMLRPSELRPTSIHRSLMRLADRGGTKTIVTTNFDLLLEDAARRIKSPTQTYALGGIPRPSRSDEFSGVLHIHGALDRNPTRTSDFIVSDQDFGEFYLRRRLVPRFI